MPTLAFRTTIPLCALLFASSLACSDRGNHELVVEGNEAVNVNISDAETDGWTISFNRFVVVLHDPGLIERVNRKPTYVRENGVTVWDALSADDDMGVLDRMLRASEYYDGVDFRIAPASASTYEPIAANVDSDVVSEAVDRDYAIRVVGSATGPMGEMISFDWEFGTNTRYRCELGDAKVVVPAEGAEITVIELLGDALFRTEDGSLAFQPIADADANADEMVSVDELADAGLLDGMEELSRSIGSVRDAPACDSFPGGADASE